MGFSYKIQIIILQNWHKISGIKNDGVEEGICGLPSSYIQ